MSKTVVAAAAAIALAAIMPSAPAMAAQRFDFSFGCSSSPVIGPVALVRVAAVSTCAGVTGSFDLDHQGGTLAAGDYFTTFDASGRSSGPISNVHAVVSGASSGNGAFGPADFSAVTFNTDQDLDLGRELVGQGDFGMDKFGSSDFDLFNSPTSNAPSGLFNYTALTNGGDGDQVRLTSLRLDQDPAAAVPEVATWAMVIVGMGLVGASMRRRRGDLVAI
jgi:hypothetical protein